MNLPFTRADFFEVFARYNSLLWPCALGLWVYAAASVVVWARRGSGRALIATMLAVQWAWAGLAYHAVFFTAINPAAWIFSALFLVESTLLVWFGLVRDRLEFSSTGSPFQAVSWILIVFALLYPAAVQLEGHAYPAAPTFGVPCPTTLLTIGLLLTVTTPWPRVLAIIPIAWALIAGSAAVVFGVRSDLMLWLGAAALTLFVLRPGHTPHSRVKEAV
jgi:hypothetical protein